MNVLPINRRIVCVKSITTTMTITRTTANVIIFFRRGLQQVVAPTIICLPRDPALAIAEGGLSPAVQDQSLEFLHGHMGWALDLKVDMRALLSAALHNHERPQPFAVPIERRTIHRFVQPVQEMPDVPAG